MKTVWGQTLRWVVRDIDEGPKTKRQYVNDQVYDPIAQVVDGPIGILGIEAVLMGDRWIGP